MNFRNLCYIIISSLLLLSCSSKKDSVIDQQGSAETIYNEATTLLENKSYTKAIEKFQEVERMYPYSKLANKSQIMSAFANYKDTEYEKAIAIIERFVKLNPGNKDVPYAYYLKALCYFDQVSSVKKDQSYSLLAMDAFKELLARFPDSEYARDANLKIDVLNDRIAGKEIEVGRFYLSRQNYIGAINRFKVVVENYQTTSHIEEALSRLVETYLTMGIEPEAIKYASVLGHNYPKSKWYKNSYKLLVGEKSTSKNGKAETNSKKSSIFDKIPFLGKKN